MRPRSSPPRSSLALAATRPWTRSLTQSSLAPLLVSLIALIARSRRPQAAPLQARRQGAQGDPRVPEVDQPPRRQAPLRPRRARDRDGVHRGRRGRPEVDFVGAPRPPGGDRGVRRSFLSSFFSLSSLSPRLSSSPLVDALANTSSSSPSARARELALTRLAAARPQVPRPPVRGREPVRPARQAHYDNAARHATRPPPPRRLHVGRSERRRVVVVVPVVLLPLSLACRPSPSLSPLLRVVPLLSSPLLVRCFVPLPSSSFSRLAPVVSPAPLPPLSLPPFSSFFVACSSTELSALVRLFNRALFVPPCASSTRRELAEKRSERTALEPLLLRLARRLRDRRTAERAALQLLLERGRGRVMKRPAKERRAVEHRRDVRAE